MRQSTYMNNKGFTLVELVISIGVMSMIVVALGGLTYACLRAETARGNTSALYEGGFLAMERMVAGVKACTYLHVPNDHGASRNAVVFSGSVNGDDDFQFGDNLFPRIDEDLSGDMSNDAFPGVADFDDDGDGMIDEAGAMAWANAVKDDDEDGYFDEDRLDGIDNDGDGNIDEDMPSDTNADATAGVLGIDDDGDGTIDEGGGGGARDDDEDGSVDEDSADPTIYSLDSGTNTLWETFPQGGSSGIICEHVTAFTVTYHPSTCGNNPYISISLTLTAGDGESITLSEDVYPRNIAQECGKRVR